jgi:serine/threonine protein kinase
MLTCSHAARGFMQIGKYTLGRLIGQGGAGSVYESQHPLLARPVAIKLMHTNDATARSEFLREAQTVAALSHPHIVNILDVDEHQGQPFLVMEMVDRSLADLLSQGALPFAQAVALLLPLLDGLTYAHNQGVIHCDLKPANVLLRADQSPVLADFGLALKARTKPGELVGTPEYMAPEQFRSETLDVRTDIYALGAMLYEMLTSRLPFTGDVTAIIHGHLNLVPAPPSQHNLALTDQIDRLILQMLAKNPTHRPQTITELETRLRQLAAAAAVAQPRIATRQTISVAGQAVLPPPQVSPLQASPAMPRIGLQQWWPLLIVLALVGIGSAMFTLAQTVPPMPPAADTSATVSVAGAAATSELEPLQLRQLRAAPMFDQYKASNTLDFSYGSVTWEDDPNSILFVGNIRNDSGGVRERINVKIELLNASGGILAASDSYLDRSYLIDGEVAPFSLYFTGEAVPTTQFDSYRILVHGEMLSNFTQNYVVRDNLQITVMEVGKSSFGNDPVVRGNLLNNNNTAISYPKITVVFYNEAGQVIGVTDTYARTAGSASLLAAQSSASFETNIVVLTERDPVSYILYAEANRPSQ